MVIRDKKALFFDCDGVILDSNKVKTQAFYKAALPYGEPAAQQLVDYHITNGGNPRFEKFRYFLTQIVPTGAVGPSLDELLIVFAQEVRNGLLNCQIAPGLRELQKKTQGARWFIVSGGAQTELREVFEQRGLADLFDGGIYGSPDSKDVILDHLIRSHPLPFPALFLGDSRYDHEAAKQAGIDFIFVSDWTEFKDWESYCNLHSIKHIRSITEFCSVYFAD